jgi:cytochrome b6-f complex iron-sulfur subunit
MRKTREEISHETERSRRSFLTKLWIGLGIVALIEFIGVAIAFLRPRRLPANTADKGAVLEAGAVETFTPNSVTAFVRARLYLCRLEDGGFLALSRKCTHLGCTVPWVAKESRFACPCHGSAFDVTGDIIEPPAPRALDMYPLFIENDIVKVDLSKPIKRSAFRPEQVTYPQKT